LVNKIKTPGFFNRKILFHLPQAPFMFFFDIFLDRAFLCDPIIISCMFFKFFLQQRTHGFGGGINRPNGMGRGRELGFEGGRRKWECP
jgi:hypothetical protein